MGKLSGTDKLNIIELKRLFEELYYNYCEEIETLADDEEREEKYSEAEESLNKFNQIISTL